MSLLDRDEVPEAKSLASTSPTDRPRVAASRATPAPTTPPPTTSTWCSWAASAASAAARSASPSAAARLSGLSAVATPAPGVAAAALPPLLTSRTVPASSKRPDAGQRLRGPRRGITRCGRLAPRPAVRGDHHLDPLEFLQIRVAGGGHRPAQGAHQVHRAVRRGGRAVQDLLEGADRAHLHPRA